MTGKRKRYSADFKAKVALEALRGELTTAQLASKHGIHQTMVGEWKRQAVEGLAAVFFDRSAGEATAAASRPPTPAAPGYAAVRAGVDQPVRVLLPACRGDAAEPGADAAD